MTTVMVVPPGERIDTRESWEFEGREAAYIDHALARSDKRRDPAAGDGFSWLDWIHAPVLVTAPDARTVRAANGEA
eukprot:gene2499-3252_t